MRGGDEGSLQVFISHVSLHRDYAADLKTALERYSIGCFVAHQNVSPTLRWETEVEEALWSCHALIALLHKGFHQSEWTDQEVGFVMGRKRPVFAVQLGETPYGFLGKFQAFADKATDDLASDIFDAYSQNPQTGIRITSSIVASLAESRSHTDADFYASRLSRLHAWRNSLYAPLREALKQNACISTADHAPSLIKEFLERWERNPFSPV